MRTVKAYKLAKPDGYDFYTGKTINYRENIGKIVKCPNADSKLGICSRGVIHASKNPNDCFIGAGIPCSAYFVEGKPECGDVEKWGFTEFKVQEEILDLDKLFEWNYTEACNPLNPLRQKRKPTKADIKLLRDWSSARASVRASVGDSVWASVRASVWASVWDSVRDSVWVSVGDSVWAYIGSLFPNIKKWRYNKHRVVEYPYQSCTDLWKRSLVPSFDGRIWQLHSGKNADIVFEISKEELLK